MCVLVFVSIQKATGCASLCDASSVCEIKEPRGESRGCERDLALPPACLVEPSGLCVVHVSGRLYYFLLRLHGTWYFGT